MSRENSNENPVQYSYEDFLRIPSLSHRLVGYYLKGTPLEQRTKQFLDIYRWICICGHVVCVYFIIYTLFDGSIDSIPVLMKWATNVSYWINAERKCLTSLHHKTIKRLSDKLEALYPKTRQQRIDYQVSEFYWPRSLITIILIFFFSTVVVMLAPLFQTVFLYFYRPGSDFLYLHYYPFFHFDPQRHTMWHYVGLYSVELLHASHVTVYNTATDLWLVCFQVQICIHFNYLNRALLNFEPHRDHDLRDRQFLANLLSKHNALFDLQRDLNDIYGSSMLFTLVSTAIFLCTVFAYIQIIGLDFEGTITLVFTLTTIMQFYLVCYYGQLVNSLSTSIANAAYSHNWYDASLSCKKDLQFIAMRAQKSVELSAMGYLPISLETFKQA